MRIPLDYYRILGLPMQATADQLKQAHRDRTLQLPRREYSEAAIATRRSLLDQAYAVLSDPEQRKQVDETLLSTQYESDSDAITIEIDDQQLIGGLLILQELGEYELVLKIGRPYLSSGTATIKDGRFGDPRIVLSDIVLTIALACLELGREQWQQGQYESAAEALETGQELLLREGLFAGVRGEIQSDLYKLRPYRILELLALPESEANDRQHGLRLLKDMLRERGGIDGTGNDQSGLSIDDFLRFIQQLRGYLSAEEQQALFEEESRRPSAVATYLAVYSLLARGFAEHQPALIRRAKGMLSRLGSRQDVHLEQSVCALLLGQTEEASRVLELSQEYEPLAFIRENSQGAPDLLPGLCLYSERWLQDEVFPHFRDLAKREALLKEYFADEQVQAYLEELPADGEVVADWSLGERGLHRELISSVSRNGRSRSQTFVTEENLGGYRSATATLTAETAPLPAAERSAKLGSNGARTKPRSERPRNGRPRPAQARFQAPDHDESTAPPRESRRSRWLLLLLGVAMAMGLGFLMIRALRAILSPGAPAVDPLLVQLDQPIVNLKPAEQPVSLTGEMNVALAQTAIETWLNAKKAAMGSNHDPSKLTQVLAEPKLAEWQRASDEAKRENQHIEYDHAVKVDTVEVSPTDPTQAIAKATVTEVRKYFSPGQPAETQTDRDMTVSYTLVRQDNQWRIKTWQ
ncbi:IMS domain-containing protein [Leptolyngbya sp. GGD]|uniref:IMS domain-containing protein n=1 Tax=Leptolyngbya sp. GGD TaxID=2997907 RepID=UPI00227B979C|nr:IMS domain-containing protein [Leptolyngbya sp. GGD]MCY6490420.1 IMS domain-containing protein [Leptolyngbya sp. GGD]